MIMTAELNSHQRVSYYTGVKLIRHHQSASTANPNSTASNSNSNSVSANSATTRGYYNHHNHYPPHLGSHHPPHPHQQHHPPLPPHHPGHFHLPCPTGPPHIQHPGGVLHVGNHHGPQHHQHHQNGHHQYNGGGSNQTTRLYTGSPLIRSTGYHSSSSVPGGLANHKRSFKGQQHRNHNNNHHHVHHTNIRGGNIGSPNLHHHQGIIGGSCSSGSSSSSSSNEHLNNFQSPTSSPITQAKLDISPLKLSGSAALNGELSSSSNNSSPGPQGSPSPSTSSNLSTSSSPNSTDVNKDLDHFYFLDEHWKPSNDVGSRVGLGITSLDIMDLTSSGHGAQWNSSGSGSPSPPSSAGARSLNMMVDQFFANGRRNSSNNLGLEDENDNFISLNGQGMNGCLLRDSNNNIVGRQYPDVNETEHRNDQFDRSFSSCNSGTTSYSTEVGAFASSLLDFGPRTNFNIPSAATTTVVNVETQIGTFNGQRDLEIRLCFMKGDHSKIGNGSLFGASSNSPFGDTHGSPALKMNARDDEGNGKAVGGDPFKSTLPRPEKVDLQPNAESEVDNNGGSVAVIGMPMSRHNSNKEISQQI